MTRSKDSTPPSKVTAPKFDGKSKQLDEYRSLQIREIMTGERFIEPTPERVKKMMETLARDGQHHPIIVYRINLTKVSKYKVISGATRLEAATQLGWAYIQAKIVQGIELDFKIAEIVENEYRADLSKEEHTRMRARLKELRADQENLLADALSKLEDQPKARGGRGKKGGLADAARKAGVPETTARRRGTKNLAKNASGEVSNDKPPATNSESEQALSAMGAKIAADAAAIAARRAETDLTQLREPEPRSADPVDAVTQPTEQQTEPQTEPPTISPAVLTAVLTAVAQQIEVQAEVDPAAAALLLYQMQNAGAELVACKQLLTAAQTEIDDLKIALREARGDAADVKLVVVTEKTPPMEIGFRFRMVSTWENGRELMSVIDVMLAEESGKPSNSARLLWEEHQDTHTAMIPGDTTERHYRIYPRMTISGKIRSWGVDEIIPGRVPPVRTLITKNSKTTTLDEAKALAAADFGKSEAA